MLLLLLLTFIIALMIGSYNSFKRAYEPVRAYTPQPYRVPMPKRPEPPVKPLANFEEAIFGFSPGEKYDEKKLKIRYYQLLKANHPDLVADEGPEAVAKATEKTKRIMWAYDMLKEQL